MLAEDIAKLMTMVPLEEKTARTEGKDKIEGGAFEGVLDKKTPFMYKGGEGVNAGLGEVEWVIEKDRLKYDEMFDKLAPVDGKISGAGEYLELGPLQRVFATFSQFRSLNYVFTPDGAAWIFSYHIMTQPGFEPTSRRY